MARLSRQGALWAGLTVSLVAHGTLLVALRYLHLTRAQAEVVAGEPAYEIQLVSLPPPEPVIEPPRPPPEPVAPPKPLTPEPEPPKPEPPPEPRPPPEPALVVEPPVAPSPPAPVPEVKPVAVPVPPAPRPAPPPVVRPTKAPGTDTSLVAARLRTPVRPSYPFRSRLHGEEGVVTVAVEVGADGRAGLVTVVRSSGHDRLDAAAVAAARRAEYLPARRGAFAIAARVELRFKFVLTAGGGTDADEGAGESP